MTNRPISLSKFRKEKQRRDARAQADANAVKFGRSKAERTKDAEDTRKRNALLDGHRIERSEDDPKVP